MTSVLTAYSILIKEDQQREIHAPNLLFATNTIDMETYVDFTNTSKKSLAYNHCKKIGHTKSQCYFFLHGFHTNFKFTKSKKDT